MSPRWTVVSQCRDADSEQVDSLLKESSSLGIGGRDFGCHTNP